jgi:hypothetical protein
LWARYTAYFRHEVVWDVFEMRLNTGWVEGGIVSKI